jgi:hypothetical protein
VPLSAGQAVQETDEDTVIQQKVGNYSYSDTESHPRRLESSSLWNFGHYVPSDKSEISLFLFKDGYGQERVSFHTVKQPSVVTSTPTVTAKLSASLKRITPKSPVQDGSSSSDDTESDEQKPQVLY